MRKLLALALLFPLTAFGQWTVGSRNFTPIGSTPPPTFVETGSGTTSGGNPLVFTGIAAGELVVGIFGFRGPTSSIALSTIVDSTGDIWTHAGGPSAYNSNQTEVQDIWYDPSATAGTHNLTVTFANGGINTREFWYRFTPGGTRSVVCGTTQGDSGLNPTVTWTPAGTGALIVGGMVNNNPGATAGAGYTGLLTGGTYNNEYAEYALSGSTTVTFNFIQPATHYDILGCSFN